MFSKQIIDSDAFLDMPASSQLLYFHLVMRADDEGFVGNPKKIMREVGIQGDDFKILIAKRFLITFESGVIVIKHWLIHNTIRMDRFNQTSYQDEKKLLTTKENRAYTELATVGLPTGNQLVTQVKLSKVKLSKDSIASAKASAPFILEEEIKKLEDSPRRYLNVIAMYFSLRGTAFDNLAQYNVALRRHMRPAKQLEPFTDEQLRQASDKAKKEYPEWTLETLIKILTK